MFSLLRPLDIRRPDDVPGTDLPAMTGRRRLPVASPLAHLDDRMRADIGLPHDAPCEPVAPR